MAASRISHRVALTAGLLLLTLAGCSSAGPSGTAATGSSTGSEIVIDNFAYAPMALTVSPGQRVTVVNHDSTAHTLTADDKSFDTGSIAPGRSGTFTAPTKPGSYSYICTIHQFMHGTVTVHARLADRYDAVSATIGEGTLFRVEAGAAAPAVVLLLLRRRLPGDLFAALTADAGLVAILVYRWAVRRWRSFKAKQDIREELGPEFQDFECEDLNPKTFVRRQLAAHGEDLGVPPLQRVRRPTWTQPEGCAGHVACRAPALFRAAPRF